MDKRYIEEQYRIAILGYRVARTEDQRWEARKEMAKLEEIAARIYGFEYADQIHQMIIEEG